MLAKQLGLPDAQRPKWINLPLQPDESPAPSPRPVSHKYKPDSTQIYVQEAEAVQYHPNLVPTDPKGDGDAQTVYHWEIVSQEALLAHGRAYESAYHALHSGQLPLAKARLAADTAFAATDVAWAALQAQCDRQEKGDLPQWDGVFYFDHKED